MFIDPADSIDHAWHGLKVGDWATWVAALATVGASITALWIAGRDQRRRDRERAENQDIVDFRSAILVQPAFITLSAMAFEVCTLLDKAEKSGEGLYLTSGIRSAISVPGDAYDLKVLNLAEFEAVGHMDTAVGAVSKALGAPILSTIAWSRQSLFVLRASLIEVPLPDGEPGNVYRIDPEVMPGMMTTLGFLIGYVKQANEIIDAVVGKATDLPSSLIHPKVIMGKPKREG
jgi:hypothetical protein